MKFLDKILFKKSNKKSETRIYNEGFEAGIKEGRYQERRARFLEEEKMFKESIQLARDNGVPEDEILHNLEEIDDFFTK